MYREISIKKMSWYVIRKWRAIFVTMILFALLLGVFQYKKDYANAQANQVVYEPTLEEIYESLSEEEIQNIGITKGYAVALEGIQEFCENSILTRIPCNKEAMATLQYKIVDSQNVEIENPQEYILAFYNYIMGGMLAADIVEQTGMDIEPQYITELFNVNNSVSTVNGKQALSDSVSSNFTIEIKHYDEDEVNKIADAANDLLVKFSETMEQNIGYCKLELQLKNVSTVTDYQLYDWQHEYATDYASALEKYSNWYGKLSVNQRKIYEHWDELQNYDEYKQNEAESAIDNSIQQEPITKDIHVNLNIYMFILGAMIGLCFAIIGLIVIYIGTSKLRGISDYKNLSINVLGEVECKDKKKKLFSFVDKWLDRMEYYHEKKYTKENQIQVLCQEIVLKCKKSGNNSVFFASSQLNDRINEVIKELEERLKAEEVNVHVGESVAMSAASLLKAAEVKNIVFVEELYGSCFDDIMEEVRVCENNELHILGGVIVRA